jgi:diguanylate cyclase (GGDEF)-like protein
VGGQPGPIAVMLLGTAAGSGILLNQLARRLRAAAVTDQLTGLVNRNVLPALFAREAARARRSGEPLSVAIADLDGLKAVNDSLGHQAGDRLIRSAARRWLGALRDVDTLVRYGGDEFVVVMPACASEDAERACDRMRLLGEVPCSVGVTEWVEGEDLDSLLARADRALYEAKRTGRARTVVLRSPSVSVRSPNPHGRVVQSEETKSG